jgi:ferredoxin-type protein NapH
VKAHQIRHLGVQIIRRLVQLSTVVLIFGLVLLSLYAHYRAARAIDDLDQEPGWKARVLSSIDDRVAAMDKPQEYLDGYKGTLWSMRVGGYDLADPLAAAEMTVASKTVHLPLLISVLIPVVVTLLVGKIFCSWICPAGLLFEITGKFRRVLRFAELPPPNVSFSTRNKYALLIVGLIIVGVMGLPIFALVYPPAMLSRLAHAWIFGTALTGMLTLTGLIIVVEVCVSPRWWCRTMCPGGALYGLLGWSRLLRVKLDPARCTACDVCAPVCEPGIDPVTESDGIECDNCGVCIRRCPDAALYYTIGLPGRTSWSLGSPMGSPPTPEDAASPPNADKTGTPSKRLPVIASLLFLVLSAMPARGHHILGLPHYSYKDNYPQAPTLEYPATTGPYDVLLTSYPGKPIPGEPANLAFYVKNRNTGVPYEQSITVSVLQTFTFGRNRVVVPATDVHPFEVPHKLTVTFPEDGEYIVELTMDVEGALEVIPFMMISGDPTATVSVLIAIGLGLTTFVVVVRAIKIKQARRSRKTAPANASPALG